MSRTVVIGGGLIGLWCAYELRRRGVEVVVLDRGTPAASCSWANAGWVVPAFSSPLPAPGLPAQSLRWLLRRDSPFRVNPRALPQLAPWLAAFWRRCNPRDYAAAFDALARLNARTTQHYDTLQAEGVAFEMHRLGLLFTFVREAEVAHITEDLERMRAHGYPPPTVMDAPQLRAVEPALSPRVRAGVLVPEERCVRPESLVQGLEARLVDLGVPVRRGGEVRGFARRNGTITAALTTAGPISADSFLLAAGAWSGLLAGQCGVHLPLTAARGYSITLSTPTLQVRHLVYLTEAKVAVTPFRAALRFAGTLELSGIYERADPRRLAAVRRAADLYLAEQASGATESHWMGLRPVTPDGLPLIGRLPGQDNLYIAAGHGMLGITLAPATASAIAALMLEGRADVDLAPFDPARFVRPSTRWAARGIRHD